MTTGSPRPGFRRHRRAGACSAAVATLAVLAALTSLPGRTRAQDIRYVDAMAAGSGAGTSWVDAFTDLQAALDVALDGDELRLAGGTYTPTQLVVASDPRSATFVVTHGLRFLGGYAGAAGPDPDARDPVLHETVLSGNLGSSATALKIVWINSSGKTLLDGLTVAMGAEPAGGMHGDGVVVEGGTIEIRSCRFGPDGTGLGGARVVLNSTHAVIDECSFVDNFTTTWITALASYDSTVDLRRSTVSGGHGTYASTGVEAAGGSLAITDCLFTGNAVTPLAVAAGELTLDGCRFESNHSGNMRGGGLSAVDSSVRAARCDFSDNDVWVYSPSSPSSEGGKGGAVYLEDSASTFVNCSFRGNRALSGMQGGTGGAAWVKGGAATFTNCAFRGNRSEATGSTGSRGGAAWISNAAVSFRNATVAFNTAHKDMPDIVAHGLCGGIFGPCTVSNSILWGNADDVGNVQDAQLFSGPSTVDGSCVMGLTGSLGGVGNIGADPAFADVPGADGLPGTLDDDLRLSASSPCLDAGSNDALPADELDIDRDGDVAEPLPLDLDGTGRRADDLLAPDAGVGAAPLADMGAWERSAWDNLGFGLAGTHGEPLLVGAGTLEAGTLTAASVSNAPRGTPGFLLGGATTILLPFKGGMVVPDPFGGAGFALFALTDPSGHLEFADTWPAGVPTGSTTYLQAWVVDPEAPAGVAASNAVVAVAP